MWFGMQQALQCSDAVTKRRAVNSADPGLGLISALRLGKDWEPFVHLVQLPSACSWSWGWGSGSPGPYGASRPVWDYGGPWIRVGWRNELGAGDQMDLLSFSGLQLSGPQERVRSRFKPRPVFAALVESPGRERGTAEGKEGRWQAVRLRPGCCPLSPATPC